MNKLEILILDRRNGVIASEHIDPASAMAFFRRTGHVNRYNILAKKGPAVLYIEKIDVATIHTQLNDFNLNNQ